MSCGQHKNALRNAAAAGGDVPEPLRSHIKACLTCQTAFAREQQLYSAIDAGLREAVNVELPPGFLSRARAEIEYQPVLRRSWLPSMSLAGVALVLVLGLIAIRGPRDGYSGDTRTNLVASTSSSIRNDSAPKTDKPGSLVPDVKAGIRPVRRKGGAGTQPRKDPEVLLLRGEKEAVARLIANLRKTTIKPEAPYGSVGADQDRTLEISPLEFSPLEVKPLEDVSTEQASDGKGLR